jgi:serine/threonine-protein kinase
VIDAGEDGTEEHDNPVIVFEYVEGETLKERIRDAGQLPVPEAVAYAIEIARALGAAHDRSIVHRDVKPQNVLLDEEGSAKVTDFGIARTMDQKGLTADGRVLGTTDYVSPEQALGHDVTGQSDIYALGVVLYEMLAGDVPFHGENQVAVAMKHVRELLPDIQVRRAGVSSALAAVVDRATEKDLARRYATVAELIEDLEDVLAIETARSGHVTGEAAAVIRTLPERTRTRIPIAVRNPGRVIGILALAGVLAAIALVLATERTHRGTVQRPQASSALGLPGLEQVPLGQQAAHAFDPPPGDGTEHSDQTSAVLDDDPNTTWPTETYKAFDKPGVGLYLDASPGVAARALDISSKTPGWSGKVYVAKSGPPETLVGWKAVGDITAAVAQQRVRLDTAGNRFRYYLLWIEKLPPGEQGVEISEMVLLR